ncbi:MAG: hypothetical protein AAF598_07040 [Bacteroidota bacterium]
MKQFILTYCVVVAFSLMATAQETDIVEQDVYDTSIPAISEEKRMMSQGAQNALSIELRSNDMKMIEKEWEKHIKSYKGKTKKDRKSGEIFTDNAKMRSLSANDVDMYARCVDKGGNVEFVVWYDLGGAYLNSVDHEGSYDQAMAVLEQFEVRIHKVMVQRELDDQEKMLKGFEKDLAKLLKDKEGYEKDIVNYQEKIAQREMDIEQNIIDQENKAAEIENQKRIVAQVAARLGAIQR